MSGGVQVEADLYNPSGTPNGCAVVLAHGTDGMQEPWATMIGGNANDLSGQGFMALVPHYFQKTGTADTAAFGVLSSDPSVRDKWQAALSDGVKFASTLPGGGPSRVGLMGFSLGGHLSLRLRASVKALVAYFAPEFAAFGGVDSVSGSGLQVQIHHGNEDKVVAFADAKRIESQLLAEGASVELCEYDHAGHGFIGHTFGGTDADNAKASALANQRALAFFQRHL